MNKYELEVQNCVKITVEADNPEDARMKLVNDDNLYYEELLANPYIGDAKEVEGVKE